jgi:hypothetical protein
VASLPTNPMVILSNHGSSAPPVLRQAQDCVGIQNR